MSGRGMRLCPGLFGPGLDKAEFHIFDFCQNFEYFNEHPAGALAPMSEPLGKRLFKRRLELVSLLPADEAEKEKWAADGPAGYGTLSALRSDIIGQLHGEVAAMKLDNFIVR